MSPNKAPGVDGITAYVLRKSWDLISETFTKILEECIRNFYFPQVWKKANVVVILKDINKDVTIAKSYRPVSLLPVPSKVLERLIVNQLLQETNPNMSENQHGFVRGKSTITALESCLK